MPCRRLLPGGSIAGKSPDSKAIKSLFQESKYAGRVLILPGSFNVLDRAGRVHVDSLPEVTKFGRNPPSERGAIIHGLERMVHLPSCQEASLRCPLGRRKNQRPLDVVRYGRQMIFTVRAPVCFSITGKL